jgi:long-chain fatty acid transport protein
MRIDLRIRLLVLTLFIALPSFATDGYFSIGYGVKQVGQGGAGIAFPQDSLAAATNPAGMVFLGDRFDVGLSWFRPIRGSSISGNAFFQPQSEVSFDGSRKKNFFIPELGYNHQFSSNLAFGVSIYGNGGMNTAYTTPIPLFSAGPTTFRAGVDLQATVRVSDGGLQGELA